MNNIEQQRGQLTETIKAKSLLLLGYKITENELDFLFRIQHNLINGIKHCTTKFSLFNDEELLKKYIIKGHITAGIMYEDNDIVFDRQELKVSKPFYDIMNEILWLGYVDIAE